MRTPFITLFAALAAPVMAFAQPDTMWTKVISNVGFIPDYIRTSDGGLALGTEGWAGDRNRNDVDHQIIKTDSSGNVEWRRFYPGIPTGHHVGDRDDAIVQLPDDGFLLSGLSNGYVTILRTDDHGDTLWMRYYSREDFSVGSPSRLIITDRDTFVIIALNRVAKLETEDGDIIWSTTLETPRDLADIVLTPDQGFLVGGMTNRRGAGSYDVYLAKLNVDGELDWDQVYGTEDSEVTKGLIRASGGGYCVVGSSRFGDDAHDLYTYTVRVDENGGLIWHHIYSEFGRGYVMRDIEETPDGGFVACGFDGVHGGTHYYLMRVDCMGDTLWQTTYGDYGRVDIAGEANSMLLMSDGGYLVFGFTGIGGWLVRTEPDPVNLPFEFGINNDAISFGEVQADSTSSREVTLLNDSRRWGRIIAAELLDEAVVFSCEPDTSRLYPGDSLLIPISFNPDSGRQYDGLLRLFIGADTIADTIEIALSGIGVVPDWVSDDLAQPPSDLHLISSYPNPFNELVQIQYSLPVGGEIKLGVYDLAGREVTRLASGCRSAGSYRAVWNGQNAAAGLYLLRLEAGDQMRTRKLMLIK